MRNSFLFTALSSSNPTYRRGYRPVQWGRDQNCNHCRIFCNNCTFFDPIHWDNNNNCSISPTLKHLIMFVLLPLTFGNRQRTILKPSNVGSFSALCLGNDHLGVSDLNRNCLWLRNSVSGRQSAGRYVRNAYYNNGITFIRTRIRIHIFVILLYYFICDITFIRLGIHIHIFVILLYYFICDITFIVILLLYV